MLEELAEIGMDLARALRRRVLAQAAAAEGAMDAPALLEQHGGDPGLTFSRIARAVRQTLALEARLDQDHQAREHEAQAERVAAQAARQAAEHGEQRRREFDRQEAVEAVIERAIEAEADERDAEGLLDDLYEKLAHADEAGDFARYSVDELVARIRRDLGLAPDPGQDNQGRDNGGWDDGDSSGEAPSTASSPAPPSPAKQHRNRTAPKGSPPGRRPVRNPRPPPH